ncbi:MAG: hydrogenase formation protein HypD [bacterium (Candidatus Ratteibacteria) CG15_BIG_FIL_POST_REV_8_21_14_020_41_12]|uniref:Hydrogenase formation protein HypD n=1 Tax=bacterium (Candidatus Ratteibacteria) CG15_BIG_FIL_POST_REV_8_21_14_020_41_12 TaxID=2014291 RepID=A0A2M7GYD7_9BACT|nr:MAG: hydrogenase formation protein HypD [bacterium (Candidatus Ratteibacteria) CG15_BIG_FIL_POST_REV_8_21_14_020_41_12]
MFDFFRDEKIAQKLAERIKRLSDGEHFKLMHVCGTHEQVIVQFGLRDLLPQNLEVISGPGCPVCCTPNSEIDLAIELALKGHLITTFGDMLRVPGSKSSLTKVRVLGGKVKVVYSIQDAIELSKEKKDLEIVHCAIGFETTAPSTAVVILNDAPSNFSIICSHRLIPPAMEALLISGECKIDGFIAPGHVSTIIGSEPYRKMAKEYNRPIVITGFEPIDILYGIFLLLKQIKEKRNNVEIEYTRAVKPEGNLMAIKKMEEVFEICDSNWRGLGNIPKSGLRLKKKFENHDAERKFNLRIEKSSDILPGCICDKILKGLNYPPDCPSFGTRCTPEDPLGACMVSSEGTCSTYFKYADEKK